MHNPLIDSTEMYVRTVWELEEEGITPIRARLVERLGLSAPAVSETVSRLEDEGLMRLTDDRRLELTERGRDLAVSVMRKHRLAERLLVDVIGLEWEHVHAEACRWEHVISDEVESKLVDLLERPSTDAHGNPIPGLAQEHGGHLPTLRDAATEEEPVRLERFSEQLQNDPTMMSFMATHELRPGTVLVPRRDDDDVLAEVDGRELKFPDDVARLVYVGPAG